jgi:CBS-domain-containing membrane protein
MGVLPQIDLKGAHTHIKRLQVVQNKALKTIYNTPFDTNLTKLRANKIIPTLVEYIHKLRDKVY